MVDPDRWRPTTTTNGNCRYFLLMKPCWLRPFLCRNLLVFFLLVFFLVFFFYSNVTLVCGRSDHTKDMELECCIFQPTMSPVRLVTGDIITCK